MTPPPAIRALRSDEAGTAVATLVEAFSRDPLAQWLHPDPAILRAELGSMFTRLLQDPQAVVEVTGDLGAVALWSRPGHVATPADPDEDPTSPGAQFFAAIDAAAPAEPHWYLAFLGARASGGGGGSALLRHRLARAAGPVALWTANPANIAFYARFGFSPGPPISGGGATGWWLLGAGDGGEA